MDFTSDNVDVFPVFNGCVRILFSEIGRTGTIKLVGFGLDVFQRTVDFMVRNR